MLIDIDKVVIRDRIRKDYGDVQELADDIKENGLINPPTVTPEFELIAGERRYRALKLLGYQQIEVRVMTVQNALHQLKLEISENENRKDFTFSEKMRWAEQLKAEYKKIAEANTAANLPGSPSAKHLAVGRVDEKVAEETGIGSKEQLRKAEFVNANADEEMIRNLDEGKLSINKAYTELKKQKEDLEEKVAAMGDKLVAAQNGLNLPDDDYEEVARQRDDAKEQCRTWYEDSQEKKKAMKSLEATIKANEKEITDLTRRLNKATEKPDAEDVNHENKKLKGEIESLKEQLKASKTDKESEIEAQTQRIESMDIDPEKYALGEAQRLQMDVSGFSNSLNTFIVLPDLCRRMPVQYKSLIVKQSLEAIERMEQVIELLKEGESELCKTA